MTFTRKKYEEPVACILFLIIMIFEVPFLYLFLLSGFIMVFIYTSIYKRKAIMNLELLILFLFIALYFLLDKQLEQSTAYKIGYIVSTVSLYFCGYHMSFKNLDILDRTRKIDYVIRVISLAYVSYLFLTIVYSSIQGQFGITRNPLNLWTGTLRAATHYATMCIIPLAYGIFNLIIGVKKQKRIAGLMLIVFSSIIMILTASRTLLFLIPFGIIVGYFANILMEGRFTRRHAHQLAVSLILLTLGVLFFVFDIFGIQIIFFKSQLGLRYLEGHAPTLMDDGRWKNIEYFFANISKSINGGGYTRANSGNLHNLYLNVFDLSGIVPFLLLVWFTVLVVLDFRRLKSNCSITNSGRLLLLIVFTLSFLQMLVEPIMESVPVFMWCILLICGMQSRVSYYRHKSKVPITNRSVDESVSYSSPHQTEDENEIKSTSNELSSGRT